MQPFCALTVPYTLAGLNPLPLGQALAKALSFYTTDLDCARGSLGSACHISVYSGFQPRCHAPSVRRGRYLHRVLDRRHQRALTIHNGGFNALPHFPDITQYLAWFTTLRD